MSTCPFYSIPSNPTFVNKTGGLQRYAVFFLTSTHYIYFERKHEKLELMFMKHYAPNRCLYIKVAKLRTGVGGGGGSGWGGGGQDGCERRIKVFVKIPNFFILFFFFLGGGGGGVGSGGGRVGGQGRCEQRNEVFVENKKKCGGVGSEGGGFGFGGSGWV